MEGLVCRRYLLASDGATLYVALQGTKSGRDLVTDFNFWLRPIWDQDSPDLQERLVRMPERTNSPSAVSMYGQDVKIGPEGSWSRRTHYAQQL